MTALDDSRPSADELTRSAGATCIKQQIGAYQLIQLVGEAAHRETGEAA